jgi:microcystin-dependent protein
MPYLGEIILFAGPYEIEGWMRCDGRTLDINKYQALYSILGTAYGGDGRKTFNLPDLQNTFPLQPTAVKQIGVKAGAVSVTIKTANLPQHTHGFNDPNKILTDGIPPHTHTINIPGHTHSFAMPTFNGNDGSGIPAGGAPDAGSSYSPTSNASGFPGTTGAGGATTATTDAGTVVASSSGSASELSIAMGGGVPTPQPISIMPPSVTMNFLMCIEGGDYPPRAD